MSVSAARSTKNIIPPHFTATLSKTTPIEAVMRPRSLLVLSFVFFSSTLLAKPAAIEPAVSDAVTYDQQYVTFPATTSPTEIPLSGLDGRPIRMSRNMCYRTYYCSCSVASQEENCGFTKGMKACACDQIAPQETCSEDGTTIINKCVPPENGACKGEYCGIKTLEPVPSATGLQLNFCRSVVKPRYGSYSSNTACNPGYRCPASMEPSNTMCKLGDDPILIAAPCEPIPIGEGGRFTPPPRIIKP